MAREVELCEYLPEVIKTNREFQTLCCSQTPQVNALWKNLDIVFENQFIESLTEYGCQRWESIIGIVAQKEDTLEIRRKRIWIRLNENLPYTWKRLHQLMGVLCGEDGYQMTLYHLEYFKEIFFMQCMKNRSFLYQKHFSSISFRNCYVKMLLNDKETH